METPSIGRIVHYVAQDGRHKAAIIMDVNQTDSPSVDLMVALQQGWRTYHSVTYHQPGAGEAGVENSWHWPERV